MFSYKQEVKQEIREFLKPFQNTDTLCVLLNAEKPEQALEYHTVFDIIYDNIYELGSATGQPKGIALVTLKERVGSDLETLGYYLESEATRNYIISKTAETLTNNNIEDWKELERFLKAEVADRAFKEVLSELKTITD